MTRCTTASTIKPRSSGRRPSGPRLPAATSSTAGTCTSSAAFARCSWSTLRRRSACSRPRARCVCDSVTQYETRNKRKMRRLSCPVPAYKYAWYLWIMDGQSRWFFLAVALKIERTVQILLLSMYWSAIAICVWRKVAWVWQAGLLGCSLVLVRSISSCSAVWGTHASRA